jgi:CxxC-x17-CxxC domain-containing protein
MGNFNRGGGGRSFGGSGSRFGGRDDGPRQMYPAVCSECGQDCQIPFKPSGERPVFCSNCFKSQGDSRPRFESKSFGGGNRDNQRGGFGGNSGAPAGGVSKAQFDALNVKVDKILALLSPKKSEAVFEADEEFFEVEDKKKDAVKKGKNPLKKAKAKKK